MKKIYIFVFLSYALFATAQQPPFINVTINQPLAICAPGQCTDLTAVFPTLQQTDSYNVSSIEYQPQATFIGWTPINVLGDDIWSSIINLPFNFSFYGITYDKILVGSNGVVTFDMSQTPQVAGGCPANFNTTIPSANFPIKNAIYGVYQDQSLATIVGPNTEVNYLVLSQGTFAAPNRRVIINFSSVPLAGSACTSAGLQTSEIVLYEGYNMIDVYVANRTSCAAINNGNGVLGIQNAAGTLATTPPSRNTGTWSATQEAYRFSPSGADFTPTISWSANGTAIASSNLNPFSVCPNSATTFSANVHYNNDIVNVSSDLLVNLSQDETSNPSDIILCTDNAAPYIFDLTTNIASVLSTVNPNDYEIAFHQSYTDALYVTGSIGNPATFSSNSSNQTIYMSIQNISGSGCIFVKSFNLQVNPIPEMPIGATTQTFTSGETIEALEVIGQNIQWYAVAQGGEPLPTNTILVSGSTYYATQTVASCESRVNSMRLAVTVIDENLKTAEFSATDIRLYPNPANQMIHISFPKNMAQIAVYNVMGQLVLQRNQVGKELNLDLSTLNSGSYFIKVKSDNETVVSKFIKK